MNGVLNALSAIWIVSVILAHLPFQAQAQISGPDLLTQTATEWSALTVSVLDEALSTSPEFSIRAFTEALERGDDPRRSAPMSQRFSHLRKHIQEHIVRPKQFQCRELFR